MADDGSTQSTTVWAMPTFHFQVKIDTEVISFKEVTGLSSETAIIEYRAGDDKEMHTKKMPGLRKFGNVTLKKGVFKSDNKLWDWFIAPKMNTVKRLPVTISMLDEEAAPVMVWELTNTFVVKLTDTSLNAESNEVALESVEICCESQKRI